ncbi:hypothetical protein ACLVWQ_10590 (plasmid) [Streptomyces sp. CWNU-52B]|uniref:hypothetical protein n=1 Tax=unclassified Streptomyces TaxID=2593676 RepID=UPI0039C31120
MSGYDERERHEEHGRLGDADEHEQHAGNGTVNHGPSENSGPRESGHSDTADTTDAAVTKAAADAKAAAGSEPDAPKDSESDAASDVDSDAAPGRTPAERLGAGEAGTDGAGTDGAGPDVFGTDELGLRRLLHQAVEEIEPTDGTLDHLRRAVPARRARKRQALVGAAAAALFIGTAVPALLHVSNSTGSDADPSMAGNASATQGGGNEGKEASAGSNSGNSSDSSKGSGKGGKKDESDKGKGGKGGTGGVEPSVSMASAPTCAPAQLAASSGGAGAPDATGAVYGTFTITNVSGASCTVVGGGSMSPAALGAADQSRLGTALHVAGDPAGGLPDPSTYAASLVLPPSGTYTVQFAWVPSETCPTAGGDNGGGDPSPDPTPTDNPSGGTSSDGTTGVGTQLMKADGTVDGSVSVTYVAEGGAPVTSATVANACAGTIYRTGILSGA